MKILKYIFLLLLLAFIAVTIFVATQKGDFNVQRSVVIKSSRPTVFNFINDFRNWETFGSWAKALSILGKAPTETATSKIWK